MDRGLVESGASKREKKTGAEKGVPGETVRLDMTFQGERCKASTTTERKNERGRHISGI